MADHPKLLVTRDGAVTRITFNNPERRNAVDPAMCVALRDAVLAAADDDSRVVVLTGAGGEAFCSGADLKAGAPVNDVTEYLRTVTNPTIRALREMAKPVIARVNGVAAGVGFNYALAADIRIAVDTARFSQAFVKIGLIPDGGSTFLLSRMIGYARAFELMISGDVIDAPRALALGLVNRVVTAEELDGVVDGLAARLAAAPALAVAGIKRAVGFGEEHSLAESLDFEAVAQKGCIESADFREGVAAFLQKRAPRFEGR
ncbi:MAG: enoyl-CoA hydratase-related protein [Bryobacteraceae bacterium]